MADGGGDERKERLLRKDCGKKDDETQGEVRKRDRGRSSNAVCSSND